jgi:hypothetical protein
MADYAVSFPEKQLYMKHLQEAKARRQAVLQRVRKQRAQVAKRTVAGWMQDGVVIRASELKERYQSRKESFAEFGMRGP